MSDLHSTLPLGIRLNNPGNLRAASGPDFKTVLTSGFATFDKMENGARCLFYLIHGYYTHLGHRTLPAFISTYAPATENDTAAYIRTMCQSLGLNPLAMATTDLHLDQPWRALDMARGIIRIEQGRSVPAVAAYPEWVGPATLVDAMRNTGKWGVL